MNTLRLGICPRKLVEQSHRNIDIEVDGFSPEPSEQIVCDPDCQGYVFRETGIARRIGNWVLPGIISETSNIPYCPKR